MDDKNTLPGVWPLTWLLVPSKYTVAASHWLRQPERTHVPAYRGDVFSGLAPELLWMFTKSPAASASLVVTTAVSARYQQASWCASSRRCRPAAPVCLRRPAPAGVLALRMLVSSTPLAFSAGILSVPAAPALVVSAASSARLPALFWMNFFG